MTTDFIEDWPHSDVRVILEMKVSEEELEQIIAYFDSAELSEFKYSRVYEELMDTLLLARRSIKVYKTLRYREDETD